jgi:oligopeptide/dipeptide ABC transporter ATP-binding protein
MPLPVPSDGEPPANNSAGLAEIATPPLLRVEGLTVGFDSDRGFLPAVNGISLHVAPGETLGLVGESGSGKSLTALAILRLIEPPGRIAGGSICFQGKDLLGLTEPAMCAVRGAGIGLVFQEPMTALNPVLPVGDQIAESLVVHGRASWREARARAVELLASVRIPDPVRRARDYPHQLSGGMRQRVMIAVALASDPALLIADEPTTALDVTIQAEILDLLRELRRNRGLALLLITHDLGVIAETADRVAVMYAGRIIEEAPVRSIFHAPKHPYTRGLLASVPGAASGGRLHAIDGVVPPLGALPPGCPFEPRCQDRLAVCATSMPGETGFEPGHTARCHLYEDENDRDPDR